MRIQFFFFAFAVFISTSYVEGQTLYLNSGKTSFEITPEGVTTNKSGSTHISSFDLGYDAGFNANNSNNNTAIGYRALYTSQFSSGNVAVGSRALERNLSGLGNTAFGSNALYLNTSGIYNTAFGIDALFNNRNGKNNVALGYNTMYTNQSGENNLAIGNFALYQNGGFLGSSTRDSCDYNVAIGHQSMRNSIVTDGIGSSRNVAIGHNTSMKGGSGGVSIGFKAAEDAFQQGVVIGNVSGYRSRYNTIIGDSVMINAPSNSARNVVIGHKAMKNAGNNTSDNVAIGYQVLSEMDTQDGKNTVVGSLSMSTTGGFATENTVYGSQSLLNFTSGNRNTAIGNASLPSLTTSSDNTSIGWFSGVLVNTDNKFTSIGAFSGTNTSSVAFTNATAIGPAVINSTSNSVKIGSASVTSIGGYQNFTNFSDSRLKTNICYEKIPGIDFIKSLSPAKYRALKEDQTYRYGLIAQDIHEVLLRDHVEFPALYTPKSESDHYRLDYAMLTVPLIKSIQELNSKMEIVLTERKQLYERNKELRAQLTTLIAE